MSVRARWTPFSNGTEYHLWADDNCFSCMKGYDEERGEYRCALEPQLFSEGGMPAWAVRRIGTRRVYFTTVEGERTFYTRLGTCKERVRRGDDGDHEGPAPDCPGQRFLWSDLWLERTDADRAPVEEVAR